MKYNEIEGDLIELAKQGKFDVIAHGCNCFSRMKRGIAPQMAAAFGCDSFSMELSTETHLVNKLGNIDYEYIDSIMGPAKQGFLVVNAYTQYHWDSNGKPLDYEAITLCMRKINKAFEGRHIGLPMIGAGLAGGDWERIKSIIQKELKDCEVTIVKYNKS